MKILKEKALPEIENYMFEEHDQIRQAATECMCNLVVCKEVSSDDVKARFTSTSSASKPKENLHQVHTEPIYFKTHCQIFLYCV